MKLAQFSVGNRSSLGLVANGGVVELCNSLPETIKTMVDLIAHWGDVRPLIQSLAGCAPDFVLEEVTLRAPVTRPGKIMGIGLNYSDHAAEAKMELPKDQLWFSKAVTTIQDPFGVVQLPKVSGSLDYEAELVFIIGKRCRHVSYDDAADAIFGYTIGNDVSVRDWQFKTSQFILGKSFDSHAPIGPWIETAESIDPHNLNIRCLVNDEERQGSNTRHFIFDCYDMVEHLSKVMTLEPGDIVFTGTPAGVGAARNPPLWLKDGDRLRTEIEGIGHMENTIRPEK
jgi:2-keto-4-pentenoate hydratase/2-oxohepta-3-ene-1,7-dioic acid hydratase in catechol pathway